MSVSEHQYQGILQVIERLGSGLDSRKIRELAGLELLKLLRADYFASFTWSPDERRFGGHVFINMDPQNLERYSSYYQFHNPLSATVQKLRRAVRVNEIMPQRELIRTEFYNDFLARDGLYYGLNLYVHDGDINIADMRIWRNRRRENFDDADLQILEPVSAGGRAGDLVHIAYGYGLFTGGLGAHYGAERLGCTVVPMSGGQTEKQVQLIVDLEPAIIMATPSYMLNIAEEFVRQELNPRECSLQVGIFGAEPWTDAMRAQIESRMGIDAVDIYGLSEVMGPGVAQECIETKDGPVIWEDHFYPEIIDPKTGAVLADGEEGELVLTSLTKEALPVIRFRTRDLTRLPLPRLPDVPLRTAVINHFDQENTG